MKCNPGVTWNVTLGWHIMKCDPGWHWKRQFFWNRMLEIRLRLFGHLKQISSKSHAKLLSRKIISSKSQSNLNRFSSYGSKTHLQIVSHCYIISIRKYPTKTYGVEKRMVQRYVLRFLNRHSPVFEIHLRLSWESLEIFHVRRRCFLNSTYFVYQFSRPVVINVGQGLGYTSNSIIFNASRAASFTLSQAISLRRSTTHWRPSARA